MVTDQAAGTAGMKLVERPEPQAATNDVVVQVHASGSTWDEERSLLLLGEARLGRIGLDEWLRRSQAAA